MLDSEPGAGAVLTRAPRTLRLYFEDLPDVDRSALRLVGPKGEQQLRGMHTMAADDLMIEILDPLTPGDYTRRMDNGNCGRSDRLYRQVRLYSARATLTRI